MLSSSFKSHISQILGCKVLKVEAVLGGDISKAFGVYTQTQRFFCKVNDSPCALHMFNMEKAGLEHIERTKTIGVPKILACGQHEGISYLLMEFIASKSADSKDFETLGHQLAAMHSLDMGDSFGWQQDNYIGSLTQSNKNHPDWSLFYVQERLLPQLITAREKRLLGPDEIPTENSLVKGCQQFFTHTKPALLHGDLWSGNYCIDTHGLPYLIDPAVYYGHHEVDIAMTKLFGGFGTSFYDAYSERFPGIDGTKERTDIYQLYYLLVHLNLFGTSYYSAVKHLLKKYFDWRCQ